MATVQMAIESGVLLPPPPISLIQWACDIMDSATEVGALGEAAVRLSVHLSVCLFRTPSPKAVRFKVVVAKTLIANLMCFKQGMRN